MCYIKKKRKSNGFKNSLIGLAIFIVVFSIISMIITKELYDENFTRAEKPEFNSRIIYEDVENDYSRSLVKFKSNENTLVGYLYGENNSKGLVVMAHGLGGGGESYLPQALYFVDRGWRVFSYDCTGSYGSEGDSTVGLAQSVIDLDAVLTYIEKDEKLNNLPIMLFGHSWGGYGVAAVLNYEHEIAGVASVSGYNAPMEMLVEETYNMMGALAYVIYPYEWAYQTSLFGNVSKLTAVDGINKSNVPAMIIHGEGDEMILYNGASIISNREEINNQNVIYKTYSEEDRCGHTNLWWSDKTKEYADEMNIIYDKLYREYEGNIPQYVLEEYYNNIDKRLSSQLDQGFMEEIADFYEQNLVK